MQPCSRNAPVMAKAAEETSESTPLLTSDAKGVGAAALQWCPLSTWAWSLRSKVPSGLLGSVCVTHFLLKGLMAGGGDEGLVGKPVEFLLGSMHVPAHELQGMITVGAVSPWVIKPLLGAISDIFPIYGYKKNPYMIIVTLIAVGAVINLGVGLMASKTAIVVSLFFISLQVASCTLLVDAKRSEVVKLQPSAGPDLVTFTEVGMNCGIVASALVTGPLIQHAGPRAPYFAALPIVIAPIALVFGNWLQDTRLEVGNRKPNFDVVRKNACLFGVGSLLLPLMLILATSSVAGLPQATIAVVAAVASLVVIGGYSLFIRPEISKPIMFYFIWRCLNVQLSGAFFYFFTDSPEAFPGGPNFSPVFYATVITVVAISGRMIGYMTARSLFGSWHYIRVLYLTMPLVCLAQLAFVPLLLRWNLLLGVPDVVWVLPCTFFDMLFRGWRHFPFSVLLLQATPKGLEASTMALNTGAANMGVTLSVFFGGFLMSSLNIMPAGHVDESAHFGRLWQAQVVAAFLPLLVMPLARYFLPQATQREGIICEHLGSATHGSVMERWCGV